MVAVLAVAALFGVTARAVAQMSSPWADFYETPLVSTVDEKFIERMAAAVELDPEQVAVAQELLRDHARRWDEFVGRARAQINKIDEVDEAGLDEVGLPLLRASHASHARFVFMAKREAELETLVNEQLEIDRQILEELRSVLREDQARAWAALLDTTVLELMRRGPNFFGEERLSLPSLLRDADIDTDLLPAEHRAGVLEALDGWRRSAALAAREVVKARTAMNRRHHRDLLPHTMPEDGGRLAINTASPGYGNWMRADTRRLLRVHAAARDATRQGGQAVAAALGDDGSFAFRRAYWLAALPADDRSRFESLTKTIDIVLALDSVDAATKHRIARDWHGWSAAWIERAQTLVDREDRIAVARIDWVDREKAGRDAQIARDMIREVEGLAVVSLIDALGERAASVLDHEGIPDWIRASVAGR